jgi:aquaporin Z
MKKYIVELVGTFFLTLAVGLTADPMAIGLMIMAMIYMGGHISGGYFNPAVTIAGWLRGALGKEHVIPYVLAQATGAIASGIVIYTMADNWLIIRLPMGISAWAGMVPEILMTFVLCAVILVVATTDRYKASGIAGLIVGFTLTSIATIGGLFNPAIGLASMLFGFIEGDMLAVGHNCVAHVIGPVLGALAAVSWFQFLHPFEQSR